MKFFAVVFFLVFALPLFGEGKYVNVMCRTMIPWHCANVRNYTGGGAAAGVYLSDKIAFEGEISVMERKVFAAARAVMHFSVFEEIDLLFGYGRFDPFFTLGLNSLFPNGQSGPEFGVGAYYYLSDDWALRIDGSSTVGIEGDCDAVYCVALSLQRAF